ncbi:component of SufBCD complex [Rhodobacteraceae bacterium F11138]|nr:component of SufBCD complex [Rhodobacteraceae bacterium F11138]
MDWYSSVFELIDMRSFSNLWYWIALAVTWSSVTHWSLGVPYDMVQRARRVGGQAEIDLEDMARINVNRLLYIGRVSGLWLLGLICFLLSGLAVLAFGYGIEFAQAVLLLAFPLSLIGALSLSTAKLIQSENMRGEALCRRLGRHRLYTQLIGALSIFVTAMWGMYQNLTIGVLGG